jgi:hypothetical protein
VGRMHLSYEIHTRACNGVFAFMGFSELNRTSYLTTVLLVVIPFLSFACLVLAAFHTNHHRTDMLDARVSLDFCGEMKQWETDTCIEQYHGMEIPTSAPSPICSP